MAEKYYTILTAVGKAKIANAQVLGRKVDITHLAVGDRQYNPSENQTALQSEVWRGNISSIHTDEENPNWIILEAVIPADAGGFNVREVGVFDAEGDLIAVGKYPETYKPILTEGSAKDLYLRMIIEVTNTSSVQLKIDPTIAMPSRKWVEEEIGKHANTKASLTQAGHVQLSDDINSTSTTEAVTPSAVKKVNDIVIAHKEKIATNETNIEKHEKDIFSMDIRMNSIERKMGRYSGGRSHSFHVSSLGSDYNDGSLSKPFRTIEKALRAVDENGANHAVIHVLSDIENESLSKHAVGFKRLNQVTIAGSEWDESEKKYRNVQRSINGYLGFHGFDAATIRYISLKSRNSNYLSGCVRVDLDSVNLYDGIYIYILDNLNVNMTNCKVIGLNNDFNSYGIYISACGNVSFAGTSTVSNKKIGCYISKSIVTGINNLKYDNCEQNLVTHGSLVS